MRKNYEKIYSEYNSQFAPECTKRLIFIGENPNNSWGFFRETIRQYSSYFVAGEDADTGKVSDELGVLICPVDKKHFRKNKRIRLRKNTMYRVLVRKRLPTENTAVINAYMLVKVLEKKVQSEALKSAAEEAMKPVVISTDDLGEFTRIIHGSFAWFRGEINWMGEKCEIKLNPDKNGGKTANKVLEILRTLCDSMNQWDAKLKKFSADDYAEKDGMVYTWEDDNNAVTKEEFMKRLTLYSITVEPDGNLKFDFDVDGMFTDHGMDIFANISGEIEYQTLVG